MARRSKNVRCPVSGRGMVAAFALARSRLGGDANAVHVAKARGSYAVPASMPGIVRIAVREARRVHVRYDGTIHLIMVFFLPCQRAL